MTVIIYNGWMPPFLMEGWDYFMVCHVCDIMAKRTTGFGKSAATYSGCIMFIPGTYVEMMRDYA